MNTIQTGSFITLHYRLAGPDGADVVTTFNDKPATLTLGVGQLSPAIEARLLGLAEGAHARFELAPGEAFGPRQPEMVQRLKRSALDGMADPDAQYEVGDVVEFPHQTDVGALPAWSWPSATVGWSSTSTIPWRARRSALKFRSSESCDASKLTIRRSVVGRAAWFLRGRGPGHRDC